MTQTPVPTSLRHVTRADVMLIAFHAMSLTSFALQVLLNVGSKVGAATGALAWVPFAIRALPIRDLSDIVVPAWAPHLCEKPRLAGSAWHGRRVLDKDH